MVGVCLVLALGLLFGRSLPAAASLEEFETWDLGAAELDDEYGMDRFFAAFTPEWQRAWRSAAEGARVSLGCVTRERWEMLTEVRLRRLFHERARFRYSFVQENRLTVDNQQHFFGVEVKARDFWIGGYARPQAVKERHDFGLTLRRAWPSGYELGVALSLENALSDFWTERSFLEERERVDHLDEGLEWRLEGARRWSERRWLRATAVILPEFGRQVEPVPSLGEPDYRLIVDGTAVELEGETVLGRDTDLTAGALRKEARRARFPREGTASDFRRLTWAFSGRLGHPLHGAWRARWGLLARRSREEQTVFDADPYRLRVRELVATAGLERPLLSWLRVDFGYGYQDVNVDTSGIESAIPFTHGTRSESRLYIAGDFNVQGVRLRLIETLEVDGEAYDVVGVHDKGFVQIQATF
jgi:hypothetical protein